mgnify:FL=1
MTVSVEEIKAFITDAKKSRADWLKIADKSWAEIKKRKADNRLWSLTPNTIKKKARYPAWYSIFKIRQPLVLSRIGVPIGKDSTENGRDSLGATAALCRERLAKNLVKTFDFFDVLCCCRDDFLATNFSLARAYYECKEVKEKVKVRLQPMPLADGSVIFVDEQQNVIESDDIGQDDQGFFLETDEIVGIKDERVCLESLLYKTVYVDPDIRRWRRCKRLAFEENYSEPEFKEIFGVEAYVSLSKPEVTDSEAAPKMRTITVYEYWDAYEKEVYWVSDECKEFLKPKKSIVPEEALEEEQLNGLYNLEGFFPVPDPLIMNAATDEFWPVPEYYQLVEIFDDIHTIFSRMMTLTKAIRSRLLFDSSIEELQVALNEASEGEAIGITNLSAALANNGNSIEGVVQYIPIEKMVNSLQNMYVALEQRLNTVYKLSGTSDLLQGLITDPTQRTFGERQMTEKYALNQIAEPQWKMAQFVLNCYELMTEVAIKNFSDESLVKYIMPETMSPEHRQRFPAAVELLKSDPKRFRVELETDSTISLNEEYDKQMRIELVNALTAAIEKVAAIAATQPELTMVELNALKYLIQGFRQAKLFQEEITTAIDAVIKKAQAAMENPQPPPPDPMQMQMQLEQMKVQSNAQIEGAKIQSSERIKMLEMQQTERLAGLEAQVKSFEQQVELQGNAEKLQLDYTKLNADVMAVAQELQLKTQELYLEVQKAGDRKELESLQLAFEDKVATFEAQLEMAKQTLEEQSSKLELQERFATEARLQSEFEMKNILSQVDMASKMLEAQKTTPPNITVQMPAPTQKRIKVSRDEMGNILDLTEEAS